MLYTTYLYILLYLVSLGVGFFYFAYLLCPTARCGVPCAVLCTLLTTATAFRRRLEESLHTRLPAHHHGLLSGQAFAAQ